jgi:pSer/pThr/pTyr-binding forkhead associated (FHA) protein
MKAEVYLEDDPGFRFELADGLTIGRDADVSVSKFPGGKFVSRVHATFIKEPDGWYIRDEQSKNHTFVNSVAVPAGTKKKLKKDDLISLGYVCFVYTEG